MTSSSNLIYEKMRGSSKVFSSFDFLSLASYDTVRQSLNRLSKTGHIKKILQGFYYCPKYIELIDEYEAPSPYELALSFARKYNWNIVPSGNASLNYLGLSTQVPAAWSFISDGPYKEVKLDNLTIEFKHRNNKEISGMSYITALVIQAIKAIGKDNITKNDIDLIKSKLSDSEKQIVLNESKNSTLWIHDLIKNNF